MRTKIFAHRGASQLAPENTIEAFQLAYELGADGIETDVQLTKDGIPVLIHDEYVKRTTNGIGLVKDYTYDEIIRLDAGSWFSKQYRGAKIVSLEDFLTWIKPKPLCLNLELKNNKIAYEQLESIVYHKLRDHRLLDRTVISTFSTESIQQLQRYRDQVEIAWLTSKNRPDLVAYALELGADAIHIKYRILKQIVVQEAAYHDMAVRVFTVNHRMPMIKCFRLAVDGIFTDVPSKALELRQQLQSNK